MPVEDRYFYPLLPLLSAAAAAGLHARLTGAAEAEPSFGRSAARAAVALLSAAMLWTDLRVLRCALP